MKAVVKLLGLCKVRQIPNHNTTVQVYIYKYQYQLLQVTKSCSRPICNEFYYHCIEYGG